MPPTTPGPTALPTTSKMQDYLQLANLGMNIVGGITGGQNAGKDRALAAAELARQQQIDAYNRLIAAQQGAYGLTASARGAQTANQQALGNDALARSQSTLSASPLGAEQSFAQRNAVRAALGMNMQAQPTPGYGGTVNPFKGMNLSAFGPEATAAGIAERRKAIAGVDPNFQFGSLDSMGLGAAAQTASDSVAGYQASSLDRKAANEKAVQDLLNQQMSDATKFGGEQVAGAQALNTQLNTPAPAAAEPEKKKSSIWGKIGKVALKVAPIAAMAIPGVGPVASMALQAGLGAANSAANGGGLKGAILGAGMGAAGAKLGGMTGAPSGSSFLNNVKSAVLNPKGLANIASAVVPGKGGEAIGTAANFLPGAKYPAQLGPMSELPAGFTQPATPQGVDRASQLLLPTKDIAMSTVGPNNIQPTRPDVQAAVRGPRNTGVMKPNYKPGDMVPWQAPAPFSNPQVDPKWLAAHPAKRTSTIGPATLAPSTARIGPGAPQAAGLAELMQLLQSESAKNPKASQWNVQQPGTDVVQAILQRLSGGQ